MDGPSVEHIWFISNARSGSASDEKCEAVKTICHERGLRLVGHSRFPEEALPEPDMLAQAGADTVLLFAGDGTINATLRAIGDWDGGVLILPGGTMNLLAKALHGEAEPAEIIHRAHMSPRRTSLSFIEAAGHRAYVGLILGPAAHWVKAREAARSGLGMRPIRFALRAWRRMFREKIRVSGVPGLSRGYQAIFASPGDGAIALAAVDARDWRSIAELGWDWVRGDWVAARAVTSRRADRFLVAERRPVLALFDGEPRTLEPGTAFTLGRSADIFLTTIAEPA